MSFSPVRPNSAIAGVSVIVTNLSGDVLLLKHSYGPDVWGLPGGGLGKGEDPQAAATLWMSGVDFIQGNLVQQVAGEMDFDFHHSVL